MSNDNDMRFFSELESLVKERRFNVLVLSASFESRCKQIALNIANIAKLVIFCNEEDYDVSKEHIKEIKKLHNDKIEEKYLKRADPVYTVDAYIEFFNRKEIKSQKLLIDITCFTHESLLILLKVIRHLKLNAAFIYCPAEEYNPEGEDENKWLSRGIEEVRSVLGYPGARDPLKKNHLIVMTGFEVDRARKLIDVYEPNYLSIGRPKDFIITEESQERSNNRFEELKSSYKDMAEIFHFSTYDVNFTKRAIAAEVNKLNANHVIAPMNTKISTLALSLAVEENSAIQVCYASALEYNTEDYSKESEKFIMISSESMDI